MLKSFPLGGASHVLEESFFLSEVVDPVRKGPRKAELRGPLGQAEAPKVCLMTSFSIKNLPVFS